MNKRRGLKSFIAVLALLIIGSGAIIYGVSLFMQFDKGISNIDYSFNGFETLDPVFSEMRMNETVKKGVLSVLGLYALVLFYLFFNSELNVGHLRKKGTKYGPARVETGEHGNARLLNGSDVDKEIGCWKTTQRPKRSGMVFGMRKTIVDRVLDRERIYTEPADAHGLIIGATRTGKSRRIFLPSIWSLSHSGESMVITDPKGELRAYTEPYLKRKGYNVITLNLRNIQESNTFNPMHRINQEIAEYKRIIKNGMMAERHIAEEHLTLAERYARDLAELIVNKNSDKGSSGDQFWNDSAKAIITTLVLYVSMDAPEEKVKNLRNVYLLLAEYGQLDERGDSKLNQLLLKLNKEHPAYLMWLTPEIASNRTKAGMFVSTLTALSLFIDRNVALLTSTQDHEFSDIVDRPTAVFIIVPDDISSYDFIPTLYVEQLYQGLMYIASKTGNRLTRRVIFFLDEFGNMPKLLRFATKITIAGGRGIRFVLAVQDLQQLEAKYPKSYKTIEGNCHSWVYIATQDDKTAERISKKIGNYTIRVENIGSSVSGVNLGTKNASSSSNFSLTGRPVLRPETLREWSEDDGAIVLQMRKKACQVPLPDLSKYKANKEFGLGDEEFNRKLIVEREQMFYQNILEIKKLPTLWYAGLNEEQAIRMRISTDDEKVLDGIYGNYDK